MKNALLAPVVLALGSAGVPGAAQRGRPAPPLPPFSALACFSATPTEGHAALPVQFLDESLGRVLAWSWDFGDGATSSERFPVHVYQEPGDYSVTLTVTGLSGPATVSMDDFIRVNALPPGFIDERVVEAVQQTTGFLVLGENDFITWRKAGEVRRWVDGSYCPEPLVDLSEEVGNWGDHGLLGFALDPDYGTNGHVYLYYVVDRHHLDFFGTPAYDPNANDFNRETIARLTRYTVNAPSDRTSSVDPASRLVLIGESPFTGIPICGASHGVGTVRFGQDGSLLLSAGDSSFGTALQQECRDAGFFPPKAHVGAFRSQLLDSPNGKILRLDPATGDGHPSNPFFDQQDPRAWSSRVWTLGLRNPFRFAVRPEEETSEQHVGPGSLYVGDVSSHDWEELSIVAAGGQNLGWPVYQGYSLTSGWSTGQALNLDAPNPIFGRACQLQYFRFIDLLVEDSLAPYSWPNPCASFVQIPATLPRWPHRRPALVWGHAFSHESPVTLVKGFDAMGNATSHPLDEAGTLLAGVPFFGNCSIGGAWFSGTNFPAPFSNVYFHGDFGGGWIKAMEFDEEDELVAIHDFASRLGTVSHLEVDPQQRALYYLRYAPPTEIHRISYGENGRPSAVARANPPYGPSPLRVWFSAADSIDPEGEPLVYAWDFGEGEPWSPIHTWPEPVHVYPSEDITAAGQLAYPLRPGHVLTHGPHSISPQPVTDRSVVHDGAYAEVGASIDAAQAVIRDIDPWLGYRLAAEREVVALIFQEGLNQGANGGILTTPTVEWWDEIGGGWNPVQNLTIAPPYPAHPQEGYETFHLSFDPVTTSGIRLRDASSGGGQRLLTVGELRVVASPDSGSAGPASVVAQVTVTDPLGEESTAAVRVSTDNTPPRVSLTSPTEGALYPVGVTSVVPLTATLLDLEHATASLTCQWRSELVHDNHRHPEPVDTNCSTFLTLLPHGELEGAIVYWHVELTVTDPEGLSTTVGTDLLPENDCNLNGIHDATDIANGTVFDRNGNGIPDECEERQPLPSPGHSPVSGGTRSR